LEVLKWLDAFQYELSPDVLTHAQINAGIKTKADKMTAIINWLYDSGYINHIEYENEVIFFWTTLVRED
jgi:hypothetical protein